MLIPFKFNWLSWQDCMAIAQHVSTDSTLRLKGQTSRSVGHAVIKCIAGMGMQVDMIL